MEKGKSISVGNRIKTLAETYRCQQALFHLAPSVMNVDEV